MLTERAVQVLEAFSDALVVVAAVKGANTPTVLTVRAPSRRLHEARRPLVGWPRAQLGIDLLLPSADADRQVQVNLPDGVSFDNSRSGAQHGGMVIEVSQPLPLEHLRLLMADLLRHRASAYQPEPVRRCLADLAMAKAEAARETLRHHLVGSATSPSNESQVTSDARLRLARLRSALEELPSGPGGQEARLKDLQDIWQGGEWLPSTLHRPTTVDTISPRAAVARAAMVEDVTQRGSPTRARIKVDVAVADAAFFSIARFAGLVSMLLMMVVLAFFAVAAARHHRSGTESPSAEVLAATLTLFSVIQAGRLRHPDKSTLRGMLSSTGSWLIVFSIMPTVVLAIALAFHIGGWVPVYWAVAAISVQLSLQLVMWRGPLSDAGSPRRSRRRPPRRKLSTTPVLKYEQTEALHTDWWRRTTAEALMIGRQAHAYVVWQHTKPLMLSRLLDDVPVSGSSNAGVVTQTGSHDPEPECRPPRRPANLLALLRSGTADQALTFMVFREQPPRSWAKRLKAVPVPLDPDRLAPLENVIDTLDIIIGMPPAHMAPRLNRHPLARALHVAARRHMIVLDVQHPVPAPSATRTDWRWSRVRIGLRDADIHRMGEFLGAVCRMASRSPGWDVRVQMTSACPSRSLTTAGLGNRRSPHRLVLASDMDPVVKATGRNHHCEQGVWRFTAICAEARASIENEILQALREQRPEMRLAGLNYAVLHGTAIILFLGYYPDALPARQDDLAAYLGKRCSNANITVPADLWQTCTQLGHAGAHPLLRVHLRSQDRPGAVRDVLDSLGTHLRREFRSLDKAKASDQISAWHALSQLTAGYAAFTRLAICVPFHNGGAGGWSDEEVQRYRQKLEQIEHDVRHDAARAAADARSPADPFREGPGTPEDPVVSISFTETPTEHAGLQRPCTCETAGID